MSSSGQRFIRELAAFPFDTFEHRFSLLADSLGLSVRMDHEDLGKLFEAGLFARLCNIAFNGLGGCEGRIKPEQERGRIALEQEFMARKGTVMNSAGWRGLPALSRTRATTVFFNVAVAESNLAKEM